jgi:hypothetical protein
MLRDEKDKLIKFMLQTRMEEMEEVEKGIVIATLKLESMTGPNMDLRVTGVFRKRREELEMEYERLRDEISILNSGQLPEQQKRNPVDKAKENLREFEIAAKERREKLGDGVDSFNDKLGPLKG